MPDRHARRHPPSRRVTGANLWWLAALPAAVVVVRTLVGALHALRWRVAWRREKPTGDLIGVRVTGGDVSKRCGPADAPFAMGSVTKGLTGMLMQIAIERGEVTADDAIGAHLPLGDAPAAGVTLRALADHTSGLPRLSGRTSVDLWSSVPMMLGRDPYVWDEDEMLGFARTATLSKPGTHGYSNLGAALLGQALARAAGVPFADLARERILTPLGMQASFIADDAHPPPAGCSIFGRRVAPWTLGPFSPAGGFVTTRADLERLLTALADGSAPGIGALARHSETSGGMGWFWIRADDVAWHNGQVGGASAAVAVTPGGGAGMALAGRLGKPQTLTMWALGGVKKGT